MSKHALVFGSTGLVGSELVRLLVADSRFSRITLFNRKTVAPSGNKTEEVLTSFADKEWQSRVRGDVVFCCLGTTIAKAGSKEAFAAVDYELPVQIALAAKSNNIGSIIIVSSIGADSESSNFYLRTKGLMEKSVEAVGIPVTHFLRPSMLLGDRAESRPLETLGKMIMSSLSFCFVGPLKKYRAVHARTVAARMIELATEQNAPEVRVTEFL